MEESTHSRFVFGVTEGAHGTTLQSECVVTIQGCGGKPGQGFPCVMENMERNEWHLCRQYGRGRNRNVCGTLAARDVIKTGPRTPNGQVLRETSNNGLSMKDDTAATSEKKGSANKRVSNCLNNEAPQCWQVFSPYGPSPCLNAGEKRWGGLSPIILWSK